MADVTISNLPLGTPLGSSVIPFSTGSNTLMTPVSSLDSFKPIFSGQITNGVGVASPQILKFNNVLVNRGDWYNVSTGQFTAPIDGIIRVNAFMLIGNGGGPGYSQADIAFRINTTTVSFCLGAGTYWNTGIITSIHSVNKNDVLDFYGPTNQAGGGYIYGGGYNNFSVEYV